MLRSLSLKMFVVCASVVGLAAVASAQERYGTGPVTQPGPSIGQATISDEVLEQGIRTVDPQYRKEIKPDGSKVYSFTVTRVSGVRLQTAVLVTPNKVTVVVKVRDAFVPSLPLEQLNRNLGESTRTLQLAPVYLFATAVDNGQVVFLAGQVIDRSAPNDTFLKEWTNFFNTAEKIYKGSRS